jgi:GNAT superfamily N-acetyltransferase
MKITYTSPLHEKPGLITGILERSYRRLAILDTFAWSGENAKWWNFEKEIFRYPHAIGACVFLTWYDGRLAGFGSYNPRLGPGLGMVGHNCILPEFRGRGLGKKQIGEILQRLQSMAVKTARVSTSSSAAGRKQP